MSFTLTIHSDQDIDSDVALRSLILVIAEAARQRGLEVSAVLQPTDDAPPQHGPSAASTVGVSRNPNNESRVEMSTTPRSEEEQRVWDTLQEARQNTARERKDWGA